ASPTACTRRPGSRRPGASASPLQHLGDAAEDLGKLLPRPDRDPEPAVERRLGEMPDQDSPCAQAVYNLRRGNAIRRPGEDEVGRRGRDEEVQRLQLAGEP